MFTSTTIDIKDLKKEEFDHCVFVDLREPVEVVLRPVTELKSVALPLSRYPWDDFQFKKEQKYILFCAKGVRSLFLTEQLHRQGITNTASLIDGVDAIKSYFHQ